MCRLASVTHSLVICTKSLGNTQKKQQIKDILKGLYSVWRTSSDVLKILLLLLDVLNPNIIITSLKLLLRRKLIHTVAQTGKSPPHSAGAFVWEAKGKTNKQIYCSEFDTSEGRGGGLYEQWHQSTREIYKLRLLCLKWNRNVREDSWISPREPPQA